MFKKALIAAAAVAAMTAATAADFKVGVVNPGRILSESAPAEAGQNKLKSYFKSREDELSRRIRTFKDKADKFVMGSGVLTETQRHNRRRDLAEEEREISRMQRALVEERNQRSQEESQIILSRANRIIQDIAKSQNYDLILQEAVWASPRADLTEQVIKRLNAPTK